MMITKVDKLVVRYLVFLNSKKPPARDDAAICHWLEEADRRRFALLDLLIRKPRYRSCAARVAWKRHDNPHRPPGL